MRGFLWLIAIICLALWSGLAWAAYAFVEISANWTSGLAPGALVDEWTSVFTFFGNGVVLLAWAIGSIVILVAPLVVSRALRISRRISSTTFDRDRRRYRSRRGRTPLLHRIAERVAGRYGAKLVRLARR